MTREGSLAFSGWVRLHTVCSFHLLSPIDRKLGGFVGGNVRFGRDLGWEGRTDASTVNIIVLVQER